jgi:hypothetical protein
MIKAHELRIGNSVSVMLKSFLAIDTADEKPFVVLAVGESTVMIKPWSCGQKEDIPLEYVNPIALTPEMLEKAGFKRKEDSSEEVIAFSDSGRDITQLITTVRFCNSDITLYYEHEKFYYKGRRQSFLHQLQNLYFALTGEELEITL